MTEIGIRDLRADLPAAIRRAAAGETTTVTVNGRPTALIAPLDSTVAPPDLAHLVLTGAVIPPRRDDAFVPDRAVPILRNVRLDRLLREIR